MDTRLFSGGLGKRNDLLYKSILRTVSPPVQACLNGDFLKLPALHRSCLEFNASEQLDPKSSAISVVAFAEQNKKSADNSLAQTEIIEIKMAIEMKMATGLYSATQRMRLISLLKSLKKPRLIFVSSPKFT